MFKDVPEHYQGQVLLDGETYPARQYIFAGRDRMEEVLVKYGDLGDTDERVLIERGVVADQLAEYKARCPLDELRAGQIIGPRPIPTTLDEARAFN